MKKKPFVIGLSLVVIAFLLENMHSVVAIIEIIKYAAMAYGITSITYACAKPHIHKQNKWLFMIGIAILCIYSMILIDTYSLHVLNFIPGIILYPMFSAYIVGYIGFIIPGLLICY